MRVGPIAKGPTNAPPGAAGTSCCAACEANATVAASAGAAVAGAADDASASAAGSASLDDGADKRRLLSSPAETSDASSSTTCARAPISRREHGEARCNEDQQTTVLQRWHVKHTSNANFNHCFKKLATHSKSRFVAAKQHPTLMCK